MNVMEAIRRKRAVREYAPQPLPEEVVRQILYAGRRAQSSKNTQPWHFIAIRKRETLVALSKMGDFATHLPGAALCVAIVTPDPASRWAIMFDAGQAAAYMQLAALEMGVGSCLITLHRPEPSRELLGFPEDLHLRVLIAFGYPANPQALEPAMRQGGRRDTEETVHYEHWESQA
ncbi:MAG TPA: nitroreductase family protein [Chloroflexia bacterium]|nr:nitroreductase family protein [Chloroflexia bacterium]